MPITSPDDIQVRPDGLQLDEHRGFQRRFWRVQRIAWAIFVGIMLAALLGVFGGSGPLNHRVLRIDAAEIGLPRILRRGLATDVHLVLGGAGPHEVAVSCAAVVEGLTVETPGEGWPGGCGATRVAPAAAGGPARLVLRLTAGRAGISRMTLGVNGVEADAAFLVLP